MYIAGLSFRVRKYLLNLRPPLFFLLPLLTHETTSIPTYVYVCVDGHTVLVVITGQEIVKGKVERASKERTGERERERPFAKSC